MLLEHEFWEQEPKLNSLLAQGDDKYLHFAQTPDQVYSARSNFCMGESGAFEPSMISAAQPPVNNTLGPHYISNSYSFADKPGMPISLQFLV